MRVVADPGSWVVCLKVIFIQYISWETQKFSSLYKLKEQLLK